MSLQAEVNTSFNPADDLYNYVNSNWMEANPVPPDKGQISNFSLLHDDTVERLHDLLVSPDTPPNLATDFYTAAMDTAGIEHAGLTPAKPIIDRIDTIQSPEDVRAFIADWHAKGRALLWYPFVTIDDKNNRRHLPYIWQAGLGMPTKEYYFEPNKQNIAHRYHKFLSGLLGLLGKDNIEQRATDVFELEAKLARASRTETELRDVDARYNLYNTASLGNEFPGLQWSNYFRQVGLTALTEVVVSQPEFIAEALALIEEVPVNVWQDYLLVHTLSSLLATLPQAYEEHCFDFYGTALTGATQQEPREQRVINDIIWRLPEPIGRLYVAHYFDEAAKQQMNNLVRNIQAAFKTRIDNSPWLGDAKQNAFTKLDNFVALLGYPDTWQDHSNLTIGPSYFGNHLATGQFHWNNDLERLKKPVDPFRWKISSALVNAYSRVQSNAITFPAAILQPPFFDPNGDFAANYGAIGMVIGHEISHGFDSEGSKFDQDGNLRDWWPAPVREEFDARAEQLVTQFGSYAVNGEQLNGRLTLGENVADLAGALVAYDAMLAEMNQTGSTELIDGFTPEQRFFLSFARAFRGNIRPETAQAYIKDDPHAPKQFRINGTVTNMDGFYEAFDVQPGHALYLPPDQRIRIW